VSGDLHIVRYELTPPNRTAHSFVLALDPQTYELRNERPRNPPDWTALSFERCAQCPLDPADHAHCPAALHLAPVIAEWADVVSYDAVDVSVQTVERTVTARVPAQQALASLVGLLLATSGCPRTAVFRPMARFHLPFATETETAYRAAAMYLLAQYFGARTGRPPDLQLAGLGELYESLHQVNRGLARRLRAAVRQDAVVNAVVLLGVYTSLLPEALEELLEEIRPTFAALLPPD
jgi:hypothetical protein